MENLFITLAIIIGVIVGLTFFLLPALIAYNRNHSNKAIILLLNLIVGATGIGWIVLAIWALTDENKKITKIDRNSIDDYKKNS